MSTYVIGDVHGCYKEFLAMLKQIDNKDEDRIITECGGKSYVIVHAGYKEGISEEEAEGFYIYARDESIKEGGIRGGVIIAGHTPTVLEDEFAYTGGTVFKHYDPEKDTTFFNIDCGCVFKEKYPEGALACIRLEDEEVFYV